jgi:hypothetical protein
MKLNYLVVFNGQVMTRSFQMGNLQKMNCNITPFLHYYKDNDLGNMRFISDDSEEVKISPVVFTGITLLAVSLDNF